MRLREEVRCPQGRRKPGRSKGRLVFRRHRTTRERYPTISSRTSRLRSEWSPHGLTFTQTTCDLQNRLEPLASNDIQQHERGTGRTLCAALQFGHVIDSHVEVTGEHGLAQSRAFSQLLDFRTRQRENSLLRRGAVEFAHRQFIRLVINRADTSHAFGRFRHFPSEAIVESPFRFLSQFNNSTSSPCSNAISIFPTSAESHEPASLRSKFNCRSSRSP
jgi:hypothetical protein